MLNRWTDHQEFCARALRIRDKQGKVVPFLLQPAQKKLHQAIAQQRNAGQPVRIIFLKPRRVMVSAATAAEFFHEIPFAAGQHGVVVAHNKAAATEIWKYHKDFQNHFAPIGCLDVPKLDRKPGAGGLVAWENGSEIRVETANNLDAGRAFSIRYLHLSEYAYYRNARRVCGGLINSVPDDADTMIIKESTANGVGNPFHQDWLRACDKAFAGGWLPVFFAWYEHPEYVRSFATPAERAEFAATLDRDEAEIMRAHALSLEQMSWRRWAIKNKCDGSVEMFKQEYPSTAEEAFLYSGRPKFDHKQLTKMPVIENAPVGELIEQTYSPQRNLVFEPRERGPLTVYKRPTQNRLYVAGGDICEGIDVGDGTIGGEDPDWSVLNIFDRDTGEQVAKLRGRIEPDPFAEYSAAVLRWYNMAYIVPEANGPGLAYIEALLRHGYPPGLIYHRRPSPDEQFTASRATSLQLLGYREGKVSRVQLLSKLDAAIREMAIILHDPNTISEHFTFVTKSDGRPEHQDGCHDDEVFATALAVEGLLSAPPDSRLLGFATTPQNRPLLAGATKYGQATTEGRGRLLKIR